LIKRYIAEAEAHGAGILEENSKKSNQSYDNLQKVYLEIKSLNRLEDLKILLGHGNSSVRVWAATHLLPVSEEDSRSTLNDVAKEVTPIGFNAQMIINEWNAGKLKP